MPKPKIWTALDLPARDVPPEARDFLATVRLHGWYHTPADAFAYTTGFCSSYGAPDLVVCGQGALARDLLSEAARQLKSGKRFRPGAPYGGFFDDCDVWFLPVAKRNYETYAGWGQWFYGGDGFDLWQMVVPDSAGRLPWQEGFDPAEAQPDLSANRWNNMAAKMR